MTRPRRQLGMLLVAVMCCWPGTVSASEIREYALRLQIDAAGDAVATLNLTVVVAGGELIVPLAYAAVTDLRMRHAPPNAVVRVTTQDGRGVLVVTMPADPEPQSVSVEFRVPRVMVLASAGGHRVVRHELLNTQSTPIARYAVDVVFPEGWRAHAIREGASRARLEAVAGVPGVHFEMVALKQGQTAMVRLEMVPRQRSWAWLVVGLLLAAGYLLSFRDLVKPAGR
jgi:hypothetical protein